MVKSSEKKSMLENFRANVLKAAKYEIQKHSTCRATLFRFKFWVDVSRFSPTRDQPFLRVEESCEKWKLTVWEQNLQRNSVARQVVVFCIWCFAAFRSVNHVNAGQQLSEHQKMKLTIYDFKLPLFR